MNATEIIDNAINIICVVALVASCVFIAPVFIALVGGIWTDHWSPLFRRQDRGPGLTFEHIEMKRARDE